MSKDTNKTDGKTYIEDKSPIFKAPKTGDEAIKLNVKNKDKEAGGPKGKEPTRYGDWEKSGRAYDF